LRPGLLSTARVASDSRRLLRVPLVATFPVDLIRAAVELQAGRHVHGKVVIDL
jgi:hypothetical protein